VSFVFLALLSWLLKTSESRVVGNAHSRGKDTTAASHSFDLGKTRPIRPVYLWLASVLFLVFWGLNTTLASTLIKPERKPFEKFPTVIGDWRGERSYLTEEILNALWADDYVQIQFRNENTGDALLLFVPYYEVQGIRHTAHAPVSCLLGGGFEPRNRKIIQRVFPPPFGRVQIRQMVLEKNGQWLLSNYWFQQRGRLIVTGVVTALG
jgi:EpsI family protein